MEYTEEEGQRLAAEFMAKLAARPVKATYDPLRCTQLLQPS